MSTKSWYALRLKMVHMRYGLSRNIQTLLQALDDYHIGSIDAAELGRLVRLSPQRRAAVANTITKCATMIKKEPDELKTCCDLIEMCTEILEIADRPPPIQGFPFMRLPTELREKILSLVINKVFATPNIIPKKKRGTCACPEMEFSYALQSQQMQELPAVLGRSLSEEFFRIFFREKAVRFTCCCEMLANLRANQKLYENIRQVQVHWCGPESAKAFKLLSTCPNLDSLRLNISKGTLRHLNERANLMKRYFPLNFRLIRITDVLGLDELLQMKGLREIQVAHSRAKNMNLTVEMDRAHLQELLSDQLKESKTHGF